MMKFNASLNIDTSKWTQVRMVRENNRKEFVREDEMPKFGAGSEYGRQEKEEARRKKYGINTRRYNPDNQPWLMRIGSKKDGKTYKGIREGGISDNTAYYVFTHAADGSFEAHPVKEWYNFTPRVTYRTLNAEEAEERFAERGKILNHFAIMVSKKLRPNQDDGEDVDDEDGKGKKGKGAAKKELKVSDMDDWVDSEDELDSDSDSEKKKKDSDDEDGTNKNSRSKDSKKKNKKKSKHDVNDDEAFEDSDDGDEEGLEVDYMSDESSESEAEQLEGGNIKGVDQDKGLARMLDSESSSDSENEEKKREEKEEDKAAEEEEKERAAGKKGKKKKDKDSEKDDKGGKKSNKSSANNSRATTPTPGGSNDAKDDGSGNGEGSGNGDDKNSRAEKRKALVDNLLDPNASDMPASKKSRQDLFSSGSSSSIPPPPANSKEAAFEENVRRYLMRKPMTTTELLKKFKSKKTGLAKDELMPVLVNVLKRINPHKQKIKGTMYLSLKADK